MEKILFRCSALGNIMTDARSKAEPLGETCKKYLVEKFVQVKYSREKDISNRFITKGLGVEEDSITLFSRHNKKYFKKNETWLSNEFISGTPDLFEGEDISQASHIIDVKSSWDIFTFFNTTTGPINKNYYWQLQGYMALTGATKATLAYCLIDTPEPLLNDEKRKLMWKMGVATDQNPDYVAACKELERLHRYDEIPVNKRVLETVVERNDDDINKLYERAKICRDYINILLAK